MATAKTTPATSAADAHRMIWSIAIGLFVIVMAIILAGISDNWGTAMVWIMVAFILLQGLGHISGLATFVTNHQFLPPKT